MGSKIDRLLAYLFLMTATICLTVLTMVYGWGLKPQNWWWIIGAGIFGQTALYSIRQAMGKDPE